MDLVDNACVAKILTHYKKMPVKSLLLDVLIKALKDNAINAVLASHCKAKPAKEL